MSGNSRVYDPSKLHLKRELTQIRKAARVLRDPGTTSSWKSPLSSSRSGAHSMFNSTNSNHNNGLHFLYHNDTGNINNDRNNDNNHEHLNVKNDGTSSPQFKEIVGCFSNDNGGDERENETAKEKKRRVFLYNWSNRSSSEKSLGRFELDGGVGSFRNNNDSDNGNVNDGSLLRGSLVSDSVGDSLSDARNGGCDSKSDTCIGDHRHHRGSGHHRHYSTTFRCRDTRLASMASPMMVSSVAGKMKSRRIASVVLRQQLQKQKHKKSTGVGDKNSKWTLNGAPSSCLVLNQDDSVSLIDQSDGTEEYCVSVSDEFPLLSRLRKKQRFLRGSRKDDSSYTLSTPALSTSSFNRVMFANCKNPSTEGSWDGTTTSFNDVDDDDEDPIDLPGRQGCGIPCYWSKKTLKHKGTCGSCYSPSFSDTLRSKGGMLLCGSLKDNHKQPNSLSRTKKQKILSQIAQGHLPLLSHSCDGGRDSSLGSGNSDDELSTNFGELSLEGLSRLDGNRWPASCRSQDTLDLIAAGREGEEEISSEIIRSLSQRYRPIFFDELIGQNIVVQSLMNSIARGRIAPVYLFQGSRGTGKTSSAKIFAAALNCLATEGTKPCGICRDCSDFIIGRSKDLMEVDGSNKKAIDRVKHLLKSLFAAPSSASFRYKILLIDECHLLPSKTWSAFLKFLEDPLPRVVFIFITTDLENVPRTVLSRCQKYHFNKIKDDDIVSRLTNIAAEENLDVDSDALELIALNVDGSLRDAETMLDQLSLLGKRITTVLVNELVGVSTEDKLLELLELAMSSNIAETVKRARELMDSEIDPLVLMSQLASLIMDIIAGSYQLADAKCSNSPLSGRSLSETELEKLKHALKLLSESEKQLRVSNERFTWFTATLLQLGSVTSPEFTLSGSSKKQSSKTTDEDPSTASRDASGRKHSDSVFIIQRSASHSLFSAEGNRNSGYPARSYLLAGDGSSNSKAIHKHSIISIDNTASHGDFIGRSMNIGQANMDGFDDLWLQCIERCHSKTLKQLLHCHGRLLTIAEVEGDLIVYIAFRDKIVKSRAERFLISITNSIEMVLERSIKVRMILLPEGGLHLDSAETFVSPDNLGQKQIKTGKTFCLKEGEGYTNVNGGSNLSLLLEERSSSILDQANDKNTNVRRQEVPMQRIESIIRGQRLESAWLQAAERSTPRSMSCLRPEKNQVLPQEGIYCQNQALSLNPIDLTANHWDDELNHEIKTLKVTDRKAQQMVTDRIDHHPISPSMLHQSGFASNLCKDYQGYESGPGTAGCNMLFCWNTRHPKKGKGNQGTPVRSCKGKQFLCFGECRKSRRSRAERY